MRNAIRAALAAAASLVSERDLMLFAGLALVGYGLSLVYLPAAFVVPGAVLAYVAIAGVR